MKRYTHNNTKSNANYHTETHLTIVGFQICIFSVFLVSCSALWNCFLIHITSATSTVKFSFVFVLLVLPWSNITFISSLENTKEKLIIFSVVVTLAMCLYLQQCSFLVMFKCILQFDKGCVCFCASLTWVFCPEMLLRCQPNHPKSQACHEGYALHMYPEFPVLMQGWATDKTNKSNK